MIKFNRQINVKNITNLLIESSVRKFSLFLYTIYNNIPKTIKIIDKEKY